MPRQATSKHTPVLYAHPEAREAEASPTGTLDEQEPILPRQHSNPLPSPASPAKTQRVKIRSANSFPVTLSSSSTPLSGTPTPAGPIPTRSNEVFSRFQRKFRHDGDELPPIGMSFMHDKDDSEDGRLLTSVTAPPSAVGDTFLHMPSNSRPFSPRQAAEKAKPSSEKTSRVPRGTILTEAQLAELTIVERERLEWQAMLTSVLDGEVFRSEKTRIVVALDKVEADKDTRQDIWLGIRAWLRGRSEKEELHRLADRRSRVVSAVFEEILEFKIIDEPDPETGDPPPSPIEQVDTMLDRLDVACSLYPSYKAMQDDKPDLITAEAQGRIDALISWSKLHEALHQQLNSLRRWTGSRTLDIRQPIKQSEVGVVSEPADHGELTTFVDRILKEDSLHRTFEKGTLITIHLIIERARDIMITQSPIFRHLNLPDFEEELVQLISFPTKLVSASLQMRLQSAARVKDPNLMVLDTMTDDFRLAIALACTLKREYVTQMEEDPSGYWKLPPCIPDNYDAVLLESILLFFKLLHWRLKSGTKAIYFKETDVLEAQEPIMDEVSDTIEGGASVVAEQIWCVFFHLNKT